MRTIEQERVSEGNQKAHPFSFLSQSAVAWLWLVSTVSENPGHIVTNSMALTWIFSQTYSEEYKRLPSLFLPQEDCPLFLSTLSSGL